MNTNGDNENEQIKLLFNKLDKNKDGKIDFNELHDYFKELKLNDNQQESEKVFSLINKNNNSITFNFRDFVDYVSETDKKIKLVFTDLDTDHNGIIDRNEIKKGFENLGVILNDKQIDKLLVHLDKNKSLQIDWTEWRDYFRFAPHDHLEEMLRYWRVESFVDYTDSASIPNDYTKKEKENGLWIRNLVAGGMAGAISRSLTAPLDRVKIFMQVHGSDGKSRSILGSLQLMLQEGGIKSLWRGNLINVLKITPESAIKFTSYEQIKKLMGQEGSQLPFEQKFLSGAFAGWIAQTSIYPMEVIKFN
jgi:solute carrier family 25 phosphate transporter 23/24/25/41